MWTKDRKERYLKLTLAVYRVTGLFPEGELLREQIRASANKILADLICPNSHPYIENVYGEIMTLENLFEQAQAKGWIDPRNFFVLRKEYKKIEEIMQNLPEPEEQSRLFNTGKPVEKKTKRRKEEILGILENKEKIKMGKLMEGFPQVSRRTLIRDLERLHKEGIIIKTGSGRGARYGIKL